MNSLKVCESSVELFEKLPESMWPDLDENEWGNIRFLCFDKTKIKDKHIKTKDFKEIEKWKISPVEGDLYCLAFKVKQSEKKEVFYCIMDLMKKGKLYENALVRVG